MRRAIVAPQDISTSLEKIQKVLASFAIRE
jgi:hypothetical protein